MSDSATETSRRRGVPRVATWAMDHRWIVIVGWILLAAFGGLAAAGSSSRLSFTFDLPGQPAFETNSAIVRAFGSGGDNAPLVTVVQLPAGRTVDSPGVRAQLAAVFDRAAGALPGARTASWPGTGDRAFVSADGRTTFQLLYPVADFAAADPYAHALPALTAAVAGRRVAGAPVLVTGASILKAGGSSGGNSILAETLLAGVGALVVLAVVFGSLVAFLPLVIAGVAIPTAFLFIDAFTYVTTMSTLVQNIVALVGLGVAIDYALLVVTRWREERGRGRDNRDAIITAAATAGRSVVFSGITVTVSLAALALTSVPFLRSIGLAGLLIPLISIAVSTTLLPVVLDAVGPRLEWPRKKPAATTSRAWTAIAGVVVRHRAVAVVGSLIVLAALIVPVFSLNLGQPQSAAVAVNAPAPARAGLRALTSSGIGPGVLEPSEILGPAGGAPLRVGRGLTTAAPAAWSRHGLRIIEVWSPLDPSTDAGKSRLVTIRADAASIPGSRVGGIPAEDSDFIHALYGRDSLVIAIAIIVLTVLLLTRALRSLWLPIKALLLNVLSLAAAFGVLTFVWQQGHGTRTLFDSPATGAVTLWVPLAVFALLFGLSMDYEVFILTRINEEYEDGRTTDDAVVAGIAHTGRLVTSGALILCLAFIALGGVPETDVKILSTGLAAGIILDATIIRGVLAPALVALLGHRNWWLPAPVGRVLRVTPVRSAPPRPTGRHLAGAQEFQRLR